MEEEGCGVAGDGDSVGGEPNESKGD